MSDQSADQPTGPELRSLLHELVRFETELWDAIESRVRADHGVPLGNYEVMTVIAGQPGCRVQDIAAALSITVGGVSKIVDRIEAAGHCARRANPADRRSSVIELTPPGVRILAALTATVEDELERRLGPALSAHSLATLTHALARLRTAVGAGDSADDGAGEEEEAS
ncbi:MAG: winged helix-turn-helix transcriptional regulator [Actinobacteria bacterium]|nr:winged helix-turn-helix transcriptional regulator [Actinomycetota bacterium]